MRGFAGGLLDDPETLAGAAPTPASTRTELERWRAGEDVAAAVEEDKALARAPMPAARVLDHKLANWSGGRRYTCPSYEIVRVSDGVRIVVPGFQPFSVYDVILANLVPDLGRRVPPEGVEEVLRWAGVPAGLQGGRGAVRDRGRPTRARRSAASRPSATSAPTASGRSLRPR